MSEPCDGIIECDGVSIAFRDYDGEGTPILLLHGGGRNLGDWHAIAPMLAAAHRVVGMDFRSHGQSTPVEGSWSFEDAIGDVETVIDHCGLDAPIIVGHSLGGLVATLFAAEHLKTRAAINIDGIGIGIPDTLPGPDPEQARERIRALIEMMEPVVLTHNAPPPELLTKEAVRERLGSSAGPTAERSYRRRPDSFYHQNPSPAALEAMALATTTIDIFAVTVRVRSPLLFIGAQGDAPTDDMGDVMQLWREGVRLQFAEITKDHPNVRWAALAGSHMLPLDAPHELASYVLDFAARA